MATVRSNPRNNTQWETNHLIWWPVTSTATAISTWPWPISGTATRGTDAGGVYVLLGNGDGTFQPAVSYAAGSDPAAIVSGDFTGDGHFDLAVASFSGGVSILLGNGDGTFRPPVTYAAGSDPIGIVAGDFNGDGKLDLAVTDAGDLVYGGTDPSSVSVLLGNGDGTFQPAKQFAAGASALRSFGNTPQNLVAGDFTGDGRLDLATVNADSDEVSVLLGNGDGTFQPPKPFAAGDEPISLVAGDFNRDGRLDLAVADLGNFGTDPGGVSVLMGNGDGTFQGRQPSAVGGQPITVVAGDFTGDGRLDLATANYSSNNVSILLGNGDGTFQPQQQFAVGQQADYMVAGDFNGDGRLDLAVADANSDFISVLLGNGDGTFQPPTEYAAGFAPDALVAGDFNGDGKLDLATEGFNYATGSFDVAVLLGNGDGTFQSPKMTPLGYDAIRRSFGRWGF